jgi:hypothetical protein
LIRFFEINDITRYLFIFVLFVLLRAILWMVHPDLFLLEVHLKGIATQLNLLGESYVDVLHHQGPFSGMIFRLFYGTWGDSIWLARLFAALLTIIQIFTITIGLNSVNGFRNFNAFIGVLIVVLMNQFQDLMVLSPLLLGMTFIVFTYVLILRIIRGNTGNQLFLLVGLFLSIATGFLFPLIFFGLPILFIVIVYTRFDTRSIGLYLLGFSIPLGGILFYYFSHNFASEYLSINFYYGFSVRVISQMSWYVFVAVAFVPTLLFTLAFFKILAMYSMVNYQQKMIVTGVFYLITSVIIWIFLPDKSIYYYLLFIPFMIHFIGILLIENNYRFTNILAFMALVIMTTLPYLFHLNLVKKVADVSLILPKPLIGSYGKVLNLSENKNVLFNNQYGTGFCEYMIAKGFFEDESPEATIAIFNQFDNEMPDAIYDPYHLVAPKFRQMPRLAKKYQYRQEINVYQLIK